MKIRRTVVCTLAVAFIGLFAAQQALGFIKVDNSVSKRFAIAKTVFVGTVTAVDPERHLVVATATDSLKGAPAPEKFQIQTTIIDAAQTAEREAAAKRGDPGPARPILSSAIAVGQPVVMIVGGGAAIHIADAWYNARPNPRPQIPTWVINQVDNTGHRDFPGSTPDLVCVVTELKGGKSSLLDTVETKPFQGGAKQIAKLNVNKPTFLLTADVNGDGKPDLLVGSALGIQLFLASGDGFTDATEAQGLRAIPVETASVSDGAGGAKINLLIDKVLFESDGQKFHMLPLAIAIDGSAHIIASALKPLTGGPLADAALLLDDGRLLVFKNPGKSDVPWTKTVDRKLPLTAGPPLAASFGDFAADGSPTVIVFQAGAITRFPLAADVPGADFQRLTGDPLNQMKGFSGPMKNVSITPIDINGDGRGDLFVSAEGASMAMVYRGFGAFISDADMGADIKGLPFSIAGTRARSAVHGATKRPEDLYIVGTDGSLFLVSNAAK